MSLFKSILSTILVYVVVCFTVLFAAEQISDVNKYADEAIAIECQCRDGNYDAAGSYKVVKFEDGSYDVEYAARNLDDMAVIAHYDSEGNYLYTEKEIGGYILGDVFGSIFLGAILGCFAFLIYYLFVAIAEVAVKFFASAKTKKKSKKKTKKAKRTDVDDEGLDEDLEFVDINVKD